MHLYIDNKGKQRVINNAFYFRESFTETSQTLPICEIKFTIHFDETLIKYGIPRRFI